MSNCFHIQGELPITWASENWQFLKCTQDVFSTNLFSDILGINLKNDLWDEISPMFKTLVFFTTSPTVGTKKPRSKFVNRSLM